MSKRYGHVKISRKTFDATDGDPFWLETRTFSRWEAWVYLIQLAQWQAKTLSTRRFGNIALERGAFVASLRTLAERFRWTVKRVRTFLDGLASRTKGARLEAQQKTQAGMVYLIVNYDTYQSNETADGTPKGTAKGIERAQRGHKNKQLSSKAVKDTDSDAPDGTPPGTPTRPTTPPKYPQYPTETCDALYDAYVRLRGPIAYSLFRKQTASLFPTENTIEALVGAMEAWGEWVETLNPKEATFQKAPAWVTEIRRWVRLGAMPRVDLNGVTERGYLAAGVIAA